jgi:phosphoribosylpyrophosphate synthetase
MNEKFKIFSGTNSIYLSEKVIATDNMLKLSQSKLIKFPDGEFVPILDESVRGENFILFNLYFHHVLI